MPKTRKSQATKKIRDYNLSYWKENPAKNHYRRAQGRCLYDKDSSYYQRVNFDITVADVEKAWDRDNADQLLEPSIDRIDDSLGYVPNNIQFIELQENKRKKRTSKIPRDERVSRGIDSRGKHNHPWVYCVRIKSGVKQDTEVMIEAYNYTDMVGKLINSYAEAGNNFYIYKINRNNKYKSIIKDC